MGIALPVSICLTTYNRAAVLPKTLDSLLAQSFSDFELIISDDCSTDNTEEICRQYQTKDSRIKYYRNRENLKMPGNLNIAVQRAAGEYIANVHDGDVYRPDLIEKWKTALDEVPTAGFVFNDYESIHQDGTRRVYRFANGLRLDGKRIALHYFDTFTSCVWGTVMARRSVYERVGLFNPKYGFISDIDMWLRIARDSDVAYVNEPLITIVSREPIHPYAFVHWRHEFWTLGIYVSHLDFYEEVLPQKVAHYRGTYQRQRRKRFLNRMLICVKHRRWDRVVEGLAIWRDADDPMLRWSGQLLGSPERFPEWYDAKHYWKMAQLPRV